MTPGTRPAPPMREVFLDLKNDARLLLENVQTAALRLKGSLRTKPEASTPPPGKSAPGNPPVEQALRDYLSHETRTLEQLHQDMMEQVHTLGEPLDQLLDSLIRQHIREEGLAGQDLVLLAEAARDWLRCLYGLEQLVTAMSHFHRAEVGYRASRMGLDLNCPNDIQLEAETAANRCNRDGIASLCLLQDHMRDQLETQAAIFSTFQEDLETPEALQLLGRSTTGRVLASILNGHHIFDEQRYIVERRLDALPLPPLETPIEDSVALLIELSEFLGAQRQSRDRGWHPEDPTRSIHATGVSLWLLYAQTASSMLYLTCRRAGPGVSIDPQALVASFREGLYELLARWLGQAQEVETRLSLA